MRRFARRAHAYTLARAALGMIIEDAFARPGLFVDAPAPAAGAAAAAQPAAAAAAAPAAPAAAAQQPAAAAAAPAAGEKPALEPNIAANAQAPAAPTAAQAREYLAKNVSNAEDLKGIDDVKALELYAKATVLNSRAYLVEKGMTQADADKLTPDQALEQAQAKGLKLTGDAAAPVEYKDFTLPEGLKADDPRVKEGMDKFKAIAAKGKLLQEDAQAMVDQHFSDLKEAANQPYKLWEDTQVQWQQSVKKDPELGGTNYEPMKASVAKFIDRVGGEQAAKIREALNFTGAGNNPEIIRLLARAAKAVNEPGHVPAGGPVAADPKNPAKVLYPNQAAVPLANAGRG